MSVYIKGMEIPENCAVCPIRSWNGEDDICPFSKVEALPIGRQIKCPLVEIPPHGRLIDADELKKKTYPFPCAIGVEHAVTLREINESPTIIPGDKEEQP